MRANGNTLTYTSILISDKQYKPQRVFENFCMLNSRVLNGIRVDGVKHAGSLNYVEKRNSHEINECQYFVLMKTIPSFRLLFKLTGSFGRDQKNVFSLSALESFIIIINQKLN